MVIFFLIIVGSNRMNCWFEGMKKVLKIEDWNLIGIINSVGF